jgi:hypothetical protein
MLLGRTIAGLNSSANAYQTNEQRTSKKRANGSVMLVAKGA